MVMGLYVRNRRSVPDATTTVCGVGIDRTTVNGQHTGVVVGRIYIRIRVDFARYRDGVAHIFTRIGECVQHNNELLAVVAVLEISIEIGCFVAADAAYKQYDGDKACEYDKGSLGIHG